MSIKLFLKVRPKASPLQGEVCNASLGGDYVVTLRADTPPSCLASAAFDAVLKFYQVNNGEDFNVNARDVKGRIVLDTELPDYGAMAEYALDAKRLDSAAPPVS
ncbi:hypothetical protein [Litorivivens sp.]|uniref:hypothetical protein n=1 Tax=Litorivivens sp. TaxID=2020868 RepID=UPI003564F1C0